MASTILMSTNKKKANFAKNLALYSFNLKPFLSKTPVKITINNAKPKETARPKKDTLNISGILIPENSLIGYTK